MLIRENTNRPNSSKDIIVCEFTTVFVSENREAENIISTNRANRRLNRIVLPLLSLIPSEHINSDIRDNNLSHYDGIRSSLPSTRPQLGSEASFDLGNQESSIVDFKDGLIIPGATLDNWASLDNPSASRLQMPTGSQFGQTVNSIAPYAIFVSVEALVDP